jgi:hypothetical protein
MVDGIRIRHRDVKVMAPVIGPDKAQSCTDAPRKRDKHCQAAAPNPTVADDPKLADSYRLFVAPGRRPFH